MNKTRIAIAGYGNLGRGVELAVANNPDQTLVGIFTRRNPETVKTVTQNVKVWNIAEAEKHKDEIDVLIICGGSATDLPTMTPSLVKNFNVIDSFDTHASIPTHFENVDKVARESGHVGMISVGWDPGLFSVARVISGSVLPNGKDYTFWGRGVSQGHSDAIRRISGVIDARQYTCPVEDAMERVRNGENPTLTAGEKHTRECYVVVEDGADKVKIAEQIKTMPHYFDEYETTVNFISLEELKTKHNGIPHGGSVIYSGSTGSDNQNRHTVEFKLSLDSNPEFTSSVLCAYARALHRRAKKGEVGALTVLDIAPAELAIYTPAEQRAKLL